MRARTAVLAAAALCATGLVSVAEAAPKAVCNLIKDDAGDAGLNGVPASDSEDITSADIFGDGKTITAVIRFKKLANPNPQAPLGQTATLNFAVKGAAELLFLSARVYPYASTFRYGYSAPDPTTGVNTLHTLGEAKGVVDLEKSEIRMTAPVSGFAPAKAKMVKGTKLSSLAADAARVFGQGAVPSQTVGGQRVPIGGYTIRMDEATGSSYVVGTPSCVKPVA